MEQGDSLKPGILLLFPAGSRPTADDIERLLAAPESGIPARVSHRPEAGEDWLELLVSGLTFDLRGLSPADPVPGTDASHAYGFADGAPQGGLEAVQIVAGRHVASGSGLEPVVRMMVNLAANLVLHLPVAAVAWQPAHTVMEPRYFSRIAFNWLSGGAFPALGLTALTPVSDGSVASAGLSHFIGQEMHLEGREGEPQADSVKLAIRLIDYFTRHGPLTEPLTIDDGSDVLLAEPSRAGRRIRIWREEA
ncbi:hypothetical protein [Novosphingobium mangrovi (ex Huang et al. 2023)]|uniref:DUF4261 domain-containing protein n=1 Tax=Novosphingobium mangrovi (ex Huang et al. 2023) TaxID=2976432 RepID=A0ABT2I7Q8_9SPHN|nr:hypothetical protein [Novosphingobium mangrovi (ex Huang et al. 2023)]MCT2400860.1 hypothetical protein [Novosphingobium mangrovi (ex Huang et al. 2023)]